LDQISCFWFVEFESLLVRRLNLSFMLLVNVSSQIVSLMATTSDRFGFATAECVTKVNRQQGIDRDDRGIIAVAGTSKQLCSCWKRMGASPSRVESGPADPGTELELRILGRLGRANSPGLITSPGMIAAPLSIPSTI
jgi:hypothetical protein